MVGYTLNYVCYLRFAFGKQMISLVQ